MDPDALRHEALGLLHAVGIARCSAAYGFGNTGGEGRLSWRAVVGGSLDGPLEDWEPCGADIARICQADLRLRSRFVASGGEAGRNPHRARRLLFDGARFVAWIEVFRNGAPFTTCDLARLQSVGRGVAERLVRADRADRARTPSGGCHLVVTSDGTTLFTCGGAGAWARLPGFHDAIRRRLAELDRAGEAEHRWMWRNTSIHAIRMGGSEGVRYLLRVSGAAPLRLAANAALSPRQREVCEFAAAGATVAEIGAATGLAMETVRSHLKASYHRLGVASRLELAEALHVRDQIPEMEQA